MNQFGEMNCPLSGPKAQQLVELLEPARGGRVIDVGCGTGVLLTRIVEQNSAVGKGIDIDEQALHSARELAGQCGVAEQIDFEVANVQSANLREDSFDVAVCIGATHAFAAGELAYPAALQSMSRMVTDGGLLLIGEGYWKQPPAEEYLKFLGDPAGCYRDHSANIAVAVDTGLTPIFAMTASVDEWDEFEWRHHRALLNADEESRQRRQRAFAWRDAYLKWGRDTLGFGYYLFRNTKPACAQ